MKQFTLLIKPASADCNLRCSYCFYLDKRRLYPETQIHRMTDETLEQIISTYMKTKQDQYVFNWQGGEPTLMGCDFFRKAVDLQMKYGKLGTIVANSIQTNATLLTDELSKLLEQYKFLAGVSLDGPIELHNKFRINAAGLGSYDSVIKGIERLKRNNVEYNILTLVSAANVEHGKEVFNELKAMGVRYHQYIPCVEFDDDGNMMPWTISGESWGKFLCDIYDEWKSDPYAISVRLFDAILLYLVDGCRSLCHMDKNCSQYMVVEHNGDIYPCDFFVSSELKLGNIHTDDWNSLHNAKKYLDFGKMKMQYDNECANCRFLQLCMGDCLKHRIYKNGEINRKSHLCEGWKTFFDYSMQGFNQLAYKVVENRRLMESTAVNNEIGRNDPCPCGSGKKYKKCHGSNQ
jgi:uncharacterized protein